jgi:DNA mismatch repair protein MSH3
MLQALTQWHLRRLTRLCTLLPLQVLASATRRSLVIMDELGRGTATHDGVAIASATLQFLVQCVQCLTLFVTHYPEVAALGAGQQEGQEQQQEPPAREAAGEQQQQSSTLPHVGSYHMAYLRADEAAAGQAAGAGDAPVNIAVQPQHAAEAEAPGSMEVYDPCSAAAVEASQGASAPAPAVPSIVFLYKLTPGAADQSFGLNVAQLAGLPAAVVQRAAVMAEQLRRRTGVEEAAAAASSQQREVLHGMLAAVQAGGLDTSELQRLQQQAKHVMV